MLLSISIKNFALIDKTDISFETGFWAITGETGAGKSVFLNALKTLCGAKTSAQMVRQGCEKATVTGTFSVKNLPQAQAFLNSLEIDFDDFELEIQREIFANGKSKSRLNGTMANQNDLQTIGEMLIQMHGQSEQILLRDTKEQQKLIDAFCDCEALLQKQKELYDSYSAVQKKIDDCKKNAESIAEQKEFLLFQLNELQKANFKPGEEEECERIVQEASGGEFKQKMAMECLELLHGERGILDGLNALAAKIQKLKAKCADAPGEEPAINAEEQLSKLAADLNQISKKARYSPADIDNANARIALIQKLSRKYRTDLAGLIELRDKRKQELESLENSDSDISELQKQSQKFHAELKKNAAELTKKRIAGAKKLDADVEKQLGKLAMQTAEFSTQWTQTEISAGGAETGEFYLAPNKGEGKKPLRQSGSGGELSRILLAFKTVLAERDKVPLLVFDEVDSGISGETANSIGECLANLGKFHQVLTITHLHQVAAMAKGQFRVRKSEEDGRTITSVAALNKTERVSEIARMLGDEKSPTVLKHAKELLD